MGVWVVFGLGALTSSFAIAAAQNPTVSPPSPQSGAGAAQPPKSTGVILGKVVDAGTGKPISDAVVTLNIRAAAAGRGAGPVVAGAGLQADQLAALQQLAGRGAGPNAPPKLMTDSAGKFVFHDLPKGTMQLSATASGYVGGSAGQGRPGGPSRPIDLDEGERRNDVVIRLWKYGVIGGTVVDEAGDAAVGVTVQVLTRSMVGTTPHFAQNGSATTDDRGVYRITKLTPADYVVTVPQTQVTMPAAIVDTMLQSVTNGAGAGSVIMDAVSSGGPPPSPGGIRVGDFLLQPGNPGRGSITPPSPTDGHLFAYQTIFYPTASSPNQGTVVALESGQERVNLDFQLRPVPTARISGVVTADSGPVPNVGVRLVAAGSGDSSADAGFDVAKTLTMGDGSFTFLGVAAGQYSIQVAKAPRLQLPAEMMSNPLIQMAFGNSMNGAPTGQAAQALSATLPIGVGADDLRDVAVVLHEGVTVSGRLVFEGAAPQPTPQQLQNLHVSLTAADGQMSAFTGLMMLGQQGQGPQIDADLKFKIPRYPAGRYEPTVGGALPGAWRLKSVTVGGRELTEALELKDTDIEDVVITFTDKVGQLTGSVRGDDTKPSPTATVVIFPADTKHWNDDATNPRKPRTVTASKTGAFTANGLLGGEWLVAALNDADVRDIKDAAFLDALSRVATRVTLADGEKKPIDLQIVRIK